MVACRPIVEQHHAEDVLRRQSQRHGTAKRVAGADEKAHFQLKIQPGARAVNRLGGARRKRLTHRAVEIGAADDHAGGPAVVGNRQPAEIARHQAVGILRLDGTAHVARVVQRGVEIRVVADLRRQVHLRILQRQQTFAQPRLRGGGRATVQQFKHAVAQRTPGRAASAHEGVEGWRRRELGGVLRGPAQQAAGGQRRQAQCRVADGDRGARRLARGRAADDPQRQVLDREIGVAVGAIQPTARGGVMGVVEPGHVEEPISASSKIATARVQPAEAPRILCGKHEM